MVDVFALLVAIVALAIARKTFNQAATLRARLDAIEAIALQARPLLPPDAPTEPEQTPPMSSPDIVTGIEPATAAPKEAEPAAANETIADTCG